MRGNLSIIVFLTISSWVTFCGCSGDVTLPVADAPVSRNATNAPDETKNDQAPAVDEGLSEITEAEVTPDSANVYPTLATPDEPKVQVAAAVADKGPGWTNWLGPNYDGISHEKGWSSAWPDAGLPVAWTRDIGIGFSSVTIAEKRLYTMGHVNGKELVYCLDQGTGETIWSHEYDCLLVDNLHEGGPGATPTIDGEWVYTVGREGQLICFAAKDGKVRWSREMQKDLGVGLPEWGFTSSVYIVGDTIFLEGGRVVAYNKHTGQKLWQSEKHTAGYGSCRVFKNAGRQLLASLDCDGLRILRVADGSELTFFPWSSPFRTNSTTPIIVKDKIYISTAYNVGCGLFTLKGDELELEYDNRKMRNHFNNSILWDGHLYGFDGNSNFGRTVRLTCMEFETGKVAWQQAGFGCGSLMVADGKLLILAEDGDLVLAETNAKEYKEIARSTFLDGRCWTIPVLYQGHVYGRNAAGKLVAARLPRS